MRIVIAPDSFKGSLTAIQAAKAMATGVRHLYPQADIELIPMADGGEGTTEALVMGNWGHLTAGYSNRPFR